MLDIIVSSMESTAAPTISHLADFTPPFQDRTWFTSPHPSLPIIATCGADRTVRIYSLVNFTLLSTISGGHKRSVRSCAWKPHSKGESVLATASFDATVGIWKRWDGLGVTERDRDTEDVSMSGAIGGDGEAEGMVDEDDEEWGFAVLLDGHDSEVKSVSWSPSGSLLATCSRDKSIWIWEDLEDGDNNFETVAVLQEHSGDVKCVAWHPNEECLASGSYDDTIRIWREDIDDWGQVACLRGHEGTVWCIDWESGEQIGISDDQIRVATVDNDRISKEQMQHWNDFRALSGPRLVSCSDDKTIRIWHREPQQNSTSSYPSNTSIPSVIRPAGTDEVWVEESQLPRQHDLSIYSVAWSKRTGLLASTGADGNIVIYQERLLAKQKVDNKDEQGGTANGQVADAPNSNDSNSTNDSSNQDQMDVETKWHVLASIDAAHGIHEVNNVCWAKRADSRKNRGLALDDGCENGQSSGMKGDEEEILVSTGDDGVVKVWRIAQR